MEFVGIIMVILLVYSVGIVVLTGVTYAVYLAFSISRGGSEFWRSVLFVGLGTPVVWLFMIIYFDVYNHEIMWPAWIYFVLSTMWLSWFGIVFPKIKVYWREDYL